MPVLRFIASVLLVLVVSVASWSALYVAVAMLSRLLGGDGHPFGAWMRMFCYHYAHPFQYITVAAVAFALTAAPFIALLPPAGAKKKLGIVAAILASIIPASAAGGMLWKLHDMQAGYFTEGSRFWDDMAWGAVNGLQIGWLLVLLSAPFNILCFAVAYKTLSWTIERRHATRDAS